MPATLNGHPASFDRVEKPQADPAAVTELLAGLVSDARTLMSQQFQMLAAEFEEDLSRSRSSAKFGALSIVMLTVGTQAVLFGVVHVLWHFIPSLPMWGAWTIVGSVCLAIGLVLGVVSFRLFSSFNPLPDKTFKALMENLSWLTNRRI